MGKSKKKKDVQAPATQHVAQKQAGPQHPDPGMTKSSRRKQRKRNRAPGIPQQRSQHQPPEDVFDLQHYVPLKPGQKLQEPQPQSGVQQHMPPKNRWKKKKSQHIPPKVGQKKGPQPKSDPLKQAPRKSGQKNRGPQHGPKHSGPFQLGQQQPTKWRQKEYKRAQAVLEQPTVHDFMFEHDFPRQPLHEEFYETDRPPNELEMLSAQMLEPGFRERLHQALHEELQMPGGRPDWHIPDSPLTEFEVKWDEADHQFGSDRPEIRHDRPGPPDSPIGQSSPGLAGSDGGQDPLEHTKSIFKDMMNPPKSELDVLQKDIQDVIVQPDKRNKPSECEICCRLVPNLEVHACARHLPWFVRPLSTCAVCFMQFNNTDRLEKHTALKHPSRQPSQVRITPSLWAMCMNDYLIMLANALKICVDAIPQFVRDNNLSLHKYRSTNVEDIEDEEMIYFDELLFKDSEHFDPCSPGGLRDCSHWIIILRLIKAAGQHVGTNLLRSSNPEEGFYFYPSAKPKMQRQGKRDQRGQSPHQFTGSHKRRHQEQKTQGGRLTGQHSYLAESQRPQKIPKAHTSALDIDRSIYKLDRRPPQSLEYDEEYSTERRYMSNTMAEIEHQNSPTSYVSEPPHGKPDDTMDWYPTNPTSWPPETAPTSSVYTGMDQPRYNHDNQGFKYPAEQAGKQTQRVIEPPYDKPTKAMHRYDASNPTSWTPETDPIMLDQPRHTHDNRGFKYPAEQAGIQTQRYPSHTIKSRCANEAKEVELGGSSAAGEYISHPNMKYKDGPIPKPPQSFATAAPPGTAHRYMDNPKTVPSLMDTHIKRGDLLDGSLTKKAEESSHRFMPYPHQKYKDGASPKPPQSFATATSPGTSQRYIDDQKTVPSLMDTHIKQVNLQDGSLTKKPEGRFHSRCDNEPIQARMLKYSGTAPSNQDEILGSVADPVQYPSRTTHNPWNTQYSGQAQGSKTSGYRMNNPAQTKPGSNIGQPAKRQIPKFPAELLQMERQGYSEMPPRTEQAHQKNMKNKKMQQKLQQQAMTLSALTDVVVQMQQARK